MSCVIHLLHQPALGLKAGFTRRFYRGVVALKINEEIQVQILDASYAAYEHLLAIIPGQWKRVIIHRTPSNGELKVSKLSVVGEQSKAREEGVNFDYVARVNWLGDALDRLQHCFRKEGVIWDGLTATVSRLEEGQAHVQVSLLTVKEGPLVSVQLEEPQKEALFNDNFLNWGKKKLPRLRVEQKNWISQWGAETEKRFDLKAGQVTIRGEGQGVVVRKLQLLSVYKVIQSEWYWAWYLSDFSDAFASLSHQDFSESRKEPGMFNVLRRPVFSCEPQLAENIALLAVDTSAILEGYLVMERPDVGDRLYMGITKEE